MSRSNAFPLLTTADGPPVEVLNPDGAAPLLLICEHASAALPAALGDLGLDPAHRLSHAAWDPGAMDLAQSLSARLNAPLVAARFSRLAYDCNRPPDAPSAMPGQSERIAVPGNVNLSEAQRAARTAAIYEPVHQAITAQMATMANPIILTLHSFTPVFNGTPRTVELGVLFDPRDDRLGRALLAAPDTPFNIQANAPYGAADGVFHTLEKHALPATHLNAMIEVRNDLLQSPAALAAMADALHHMIIHAMARFAHLRSAP